MRTLCDVCEAAPARYFCAADEAALCQKCDEKVHGCNKLAGRHVRLALAEAKEVPRCDICETNSAYFFCGIDGTSLCLQCDMNVHIGGKRTHERYLLMGQRVEVPTMSLKEEGALLKQVESVQNKQSRHGQGVPHSPYLQPQLRHWNHSNTPAVATAVGEAELANSQPIDLNSGPTNTEGRQVWAGQVMQDGRGGEQSWSSDDECVGLVPELSSKDTEASS